MPHLLLCCFTMQVSSCHQEHTSSLAFPQANCSVTHLDPFPFRIKEIGNQGYATYLRHYSRQQQYDKRCHEEPAIIAVWSLNL
jgi:hypothetical protein